MTAARETERLGCSDIARLAGAWLLCTPVVLAVAMAGMHSESSGHYDGHACAICLHLHVASAWVPDVPPAPEPFYWELLTVVPATHVGSPAAIVTRSRSPPRAPL